MSTAVRMGIESPLAVEASGFVLSLIPAQTIIAII